MSRRSAMIGIAVVCVILSDATRASGQDYRLRVDARAQSVWFRGLIADSIPIGMAVPTASGGFETADGYAVRCGAGDFCYFFRPGRKLHGMPATTGASLALWGFGVQGLSLRASGRVVADLAEDDVWPGDDPSAQLIEALLEYQRPSITLRAGRQLIASRLESMGFDGGWTRYRWNRTNLELTGYAGWGLGQASAVSPLNPALNPLDEWRPRNRQIVAGAEAAWLTRRVDLRGEYRREIDPEDDYFVSERAALSFTTLASAFRVNGGLDYNLAEARLGNADATVTYIRSGFSASVGARRYRPYFSLWTLWGAFSPVPYHAASASAEGRVAGWLSLRGRAERYQYESADISTGLVPQLEDRGWRVRLGASMTPASRWTIDGNYGLEHGPGAAARSADVSVGFTPGERLTIEAYGGILARPLELRFYDAESHWLGGRIQWRRDEQRRIWADAALVSDDRERPDAASSSLSQVRIRAGMSFALGSADRTPLPPARPSKR